MRGKVRETGSDWFGSNWWKKWCVFFLDQSYGEVRQNQSNPTLIPHLIGITQIRSSQDTRVPSACILSTEVMTKEIQ